VVVRQLSRVVNAASQMQGAFSRDRANLSPGSDAVIQRVQQDLITFARKNNLQMSDLFAASYPQREMVRNIIYSGVAAVEQQYNTNARKMLGDFVAEVFQLEFGTPDNIYVRQTLPDPKPSDQPEPVLSAADDKPAAPQIATEPSAPTDAQDHTESLRQRAAIMLKPGIRPVTAPPAEPAL
jgi:hypothetical protein